MKPTFIVVGAQKGGTDSLYGYLRDHPDVAMADPKEPHYFAHVTGDWAAYQRSFGSRPAKAFGEASTSYMPVRRAAERIRGALGPGVRLVFILRDPVERLYSAFFNMKRDRPLHDARPFDEAIPWQHGTLDEMLHEEDRRLGDAARRGRIDLARFRDFGDEADWSYRYVANSVYRPQIERFLGYVPREQCLFLTTDDLRRDWRRAAATLYEFVGVDPAWAERLERPQRNRASRPRGGPIGRLLSYRVVRAAARPILSPAAGERVKSWVKRLATTTEQPLMPEPVRRRLADAFAAENQALASVIGVDVTAWSGPRAHAGARP